MRRILFAVMLLVAFVVMPIVALALPPAPAQDAHLVFAPEPLAEPAGPGGLLFPILAAVGVAGLLATLSLRFASAVSSSKLFSRMKIRNISSGDKSTAAAIEWLDMKGYAEFGACVTVSVLAGAGVAAFSIIADAASDGSDGNITIKTHATPTTADALGDMLVLECTAEEIAQLGAAAGKDLRYVAVKLDTDNASDRCVVTEILSGALFQKAALTADIIG